MDDDSPLSYFLSLDLTLYAKKVKLYLESIDLPDTEIGENELEYPLYDTQNYAFKTVKTSREYPEYTATFIDHRNGRELIFNYDKVRIF